MLKVWGLLENNSKNGRKSSYKCHYASPLAERAKDNAYGLCVSKVSNYEKKDLTKMKRKFIHNEWNSNRKNKVKSKQANYQPIPGKINLE